MNLKSSNFTQYTTDNKSHLKAHRFKFSEERCQAAMAIDFLQILNFLIYYILIW